MKAIAVAGSILPEIRPKNQISSGFFILILVKKIAGLSEFFAGKCASVSEKVVKSLNHLCWFTILTVKDIQNGHKKDFIVLHSITNNKVIF